MTTLKPIKEEIKIPKTIKEEIKIPKTIKEEIKIPKTIKEEIEKPEKKNFIGRFIESSEIGRGGFGIVILGTIDGETFALKKLKKLETSGYEEDIQREIKMLRFLKNDSFCSENMLCFRGHDEDQEFHYILTDYVDKNEYQTLNLKYYKPEIIKNIYEAILNLHRLGVAHLDIKPKNILVSSKSNHVILIDFGGSCNSINDIGNDEQIICPDLNKKIPLTFSQNYVDERLLKKLNAGQKITMMDYMNADLWAFGIIVCYMIIKSHLFMYVTREGTDITIPVVYKYIYCIDISKPIDKAISFINTDDIIQIKESINEDIIKINEQLKSIGLDIKIEDFFECEKIEGGKKTRIDRSTKRQKQKYFARTKKRRSYKRR